MKWITGLIVLVAVGCATAGCSSAKGKAFSDKVGQHCTVQFRRDHLGGAADLPVPPTADSINGAAVSLSGTLSGTKEDWVVLTLQNNKSIWISTSSILTVTFDQ